MLGFRWTAALAALAVVAVVGMSAGDALGGKYRPPPVDGCEGEECLPPPPPPPPPQQPTFDPNDNNEDDRRISALYECCWRVVRGQGAAGAYCSGGSLRRAIRNGEISIYTTASGGQACTFAGGGGGGALLGTFMESLFGGFGQ